MILERTNNVYINKIQIFKGLSYNLTKKVIVIGERTDAENLFTYIRSAT